MPDDETPGGDLDAGLAPRDVVAASDLSAEQPDAAPPEGPGLTPGGYSYEVVDDPAATAPVGAVVPERAPGHGSPWWLVAAAAVVPAVVVGAGVWFLFGRDDSGSSANASATSLLNAFTAGTEGVVTTRYEGALPPGYPDGLPAYEDATIIGSVMQIQGDSIGYIAVHDAGRGRDDVAAELRALYDADPWQVDVGQDGRDATLYQFTRIDDPDISGLVLLTESKDGGSTTIITSIQLATGGDDREPEPFEPIASRPVPDGYPSEMPAYDGSIVIEAAFQNDAQGDSFAVTYIVKAETSDVIQFFRQELEDAGLTVEDGDASTSPLEDADAIAFNDEDLKLQGEVVVGTFAQDDGYVQIDVQVGDER